MKNLALVCRSWLVPVRRTLGRSLALFNANSKTLFAACSSQIFGIWTTSLTIIFTDPDSAADNMLWEVFRSLFDCISNIRHLHLTGCSKWPDERLHVVDSLSSVLGRLQNLETFAITRSWENIAGNTKAEIHPLLFAALSSSSGLKRVIFRQLIPIPGVIDLSSITTGNSFSGSTDCSSLLWQKRRNCPLDFQKSPRAGVPPIFTSDN